MATYCYFILAELDLYIDNVTLLVNGSNLHVKIIQPDEFVNKKVFNPQTNFQF